MEEITILKAEYDILVQKSVKAYKWDKLDEEIAKFYSNEDGEYDEDNPEIEGNLCDIGERAAIAFGYM